MEKKFVKKDDVKSFVEHYLNNLLKEHLDTGNLEVFVYGPEIVAHIPVKDYEGVFAKMLSYNMPAEISTLTSGYIIYAYTEKGNPTIGKAITIRFAHFYEFVEDK